MRNINEEKSGLSLITLFSLNRRIVVLKIKTSCTTILLIIISSISLWVQKDSIRFKFDASIRERFESWDGMNAKNYGDPNGIGSLNDNFLLQRVIAGFNYSPKKNIIIHILFF